jgi:hypothetical protein
MLPVTVQFIVAMLAYALNERSTASSATPPISSTIVTHCTPRRGRRCSSPEA